MQKSPSARLIPEAVLVSLGAKCSFRVTAFCYISAARLVIEGLVVGVGCLID